MQELNNILQYLRMHKRSSFQCRTKKVLKDQTEEATLIDNYLSKLSRDGYIRSYLHPSIGFVWESLQIESDQKFFYSVTERGIKFLRKGGYA